MADTDIVTWLRSILHNDRSVELRCQEAANEIERLRKERDTAMVLIETIVHDISVLSTRPAEIIKLNDLVFHINEWGDAAIKILSNKENTNVQ